jgi:ABC-type Mn2+/Zn2+ transport system ATPase subunit
MNRPAAAADPLITLTEVRVGYGKTPVFEHLSLRTDAGEFVLLQGENGAGKSTILKTILGLLRPTGGEVRVLGERLTGVGAGARARAVRRRIGYLAQIHEPPALPMTVAEAALLGRWGSSFGGVRRAGATDRRAAARALEQVGMSDLAGRDVRALSGGQRQRVALAAALSREPVLLLMDEPTTHLDVESQEDLARRIAELNREHGISVLLVSHGSFAESTADRVVQIGGGHRNAPEAAATGEPRLE